MRIQFRLDGVDRHDHAPVDLVLPDDERRADPDLVAVDAPITANRDGSETALNNIQLTHEDASVSGSAAYTPATRAFRRRRTTPT